MTTFGYVRASGDVEGAQTIDGQVNRLNTWAGYESIDDLEIVEDVGVSGGKRFTDRPGAGRIAARVTEGDTIAVTSLDRLGRSTRDVLDTVEHLRNGGVRLVVLDLSIDTSTPVGKLMLTVMAALAELEREQVGERLRKAWKELDRQGRHHGKVPFGFMTIPNPNGPGKVLRPDSEVGPRLHGAIGRITAGGTITAEAAALGLYTVTLSRLLRNPKLYGMTASTGRLDPDAGILTVAEWQALQKAIERPERAVHKRDDTLARVTRCYHCDGRLYPVHRQEAGWSDTYRCIRVPAHPQAPTARQAQVDELAYAVFDEHFAHKPVAALTERVTGDDREILDAEIRATTEAMVTAEDVQPLVERLTDLKRRRAESKPSVERVYTLTGETGADVRDEVIHLCVKIIVHPVSAKPRLEAVAKEGVGAFNRLAGGNFETSYWQPPVQVDIDPNGSDDGE